MKALRVAIVMGGGVSLGSFGGGALAGALAELHRQARSRGLRMEIDVLSGASAGALSLGLLLRRLAFPEGPGGPAPPEDFWAAEVEEPQHRAWVREIGIERLAPREGEAGGALLSSRPIEALAEELFAWTGETPPGAGTLDPLGLLAPRVYLLTTLMNLNGLPVVSSRLEGRPALVDAKAATLFRDRRVFCLDLDEGLDPATRHSGSRHRSRRELLRADTWREIARTCLAAGAFPIAFEPRPITRERSEFGPLWPWRGRDAPDVLRRALWFEERDTFPFTYGDGGAFDNEPLREAMELIRSVDEPGGDGRFERLLLYIDPHLSGLAHTEFLALHYPTSIRGGVERERFLHERLIGQAERTARVIAGQAGFQDVREADRVNERLRWREDLRGLLATLVDGLPADAVAPAGREARRLLGRVLGVKSEASMRGATYGVEGELSRVSAEESGTDPTGSGEGSAERDHLRRTLFSLVDQVAGLRDRREVRILAVGPVRPGPEPGSGPGSVPLAGAGLGRFGGFLHRELREHDFAWGREKGGRVVANELGSGAHDPPAVPDWPGDEVFEAARRRLVEAARERYRALTAEPFGRVSRWGLAAALFGGGLETLLKGSAGPGMRLFDRMARPALEDAVRSAHAEERRGVVRIRWKVGGGHAVRSGAPDGAPPGTWVGYRVIHADPEAAGEPPRDRIELQDGPHLESADGEGAILRVPPPGGGNGRALLVPVGPGSPFMRALERLAHRLGRAETPLFEGELPGDGSTGGEHAEVRWRLVPNVPSEAERVLARSGQVRPQAGAGPREAGRASRSEG